MFRALQTHRSLLPYLCVGGDVDGVARNETFRWTKRSKSNIDEDFYAKNSRLAGNRSRSSSWNFHGNSYLYCFDNCSF